MLGIPAPPVGELAGVTYRQVDYGVRRGYVTASVQPAVGKGARRLFAPADVVRVAALGRFGRARFDIGLVGPLVAVLEPITGDQLVVARTDPLSVEIIDAVDLRRVLGEAGPCVVFDPAPLLARMNPLATLPISAPARIQAVS